MSDTDWPSEEGASALDMLKDVKKTTTPEAPKAPPKPKDKTVTKDKTKTKDKDKTPATPAAPVGPDPALLQRAREALAKARAEATPGKPLVLPPEALLIVGTDIPDPDNKDELADPERLKYPLDESWVQVFTAFGWREDPAVFVEREGCAFLVDGRGRTTHAREANKRGANVQALAIESELSAAADLALIKEMLNAYRRDDTFMTKARKAKRLFDRLSEGKEENYSAAYAQVALAMKVGSDQAVKNWIAILNAPAKIQKVADEGRIAASSLIPLLRKDLAPEHQVAILEEALEMGETSVAQIRARVSNFVEGGENKPSGSPGAGGTRGPSQPDFVKGAPPKKRLLEKLTQRVLKGETAPTDEQRLVIKGIRFAVFGETPPEPIASALRALLKEAEAKKQKKVKE